VTAPGDDHPPDQRSAPDLAPTETFLRLFFVIRAMANTMVAHHDFPLLARGRQRFGLADVEDALVRFAAAGIQAAAGLEVTR
jgi:hypothetical protein